MQIYRISNKYASPTGLNSIMRLYERERETHQNRIYAPNHDPPTHTHSEFSNMYLGFHTTYFSSIQQNNPSIQNIKFPKRVMDPQI
jgi:hypothetical protein